MLDLHKQRASMSSIEGEEPSNRSRKVSKTDADLISIQESPPRRASEASFTLQEEQQMATLTWLDVNVRVDETKQRQSCFKRLGRAVGIGGLEYKPVDSMRILKHVTGYAKPGRLMAIMGSSYSGLVHGGDSETGFMSLSHSSDDELWLPVGMTIRKRLIFTKKCWSTLKNAVDSYELSEWLSKENRGSGKTTLLNVLTKRNTSGLVIDGLIKINGREASGKDIRRVSAYVQQDDLFIGTLKVKEHLHFQARLRLGDDVAEEAREKIVEKILVELGLMKCANSIIGVKNEIKGISGGERKRLAFASEILSNPSIMFCDEPTSGLDSFMAQQVIAVLKKMSNRSKTIICTIHQPSSQVFKYFNDICLLSEGRVVYMGPTRKVANLFESTGYPCPKNFNPSDHYIRTLAIEPGNAQECKRKVKTIIRAYQTSDIYKDVAKSASIAWHDDEISLPDDEKVKKSKYKAKWITQYKVLFKRSILQNAREPLLVNVRLIETTIIAILFGLLYYNTQINATTIQNVNGLLFMFPIQTTFAFTFTVVHVFCEELPIFLREHSSNLYRVDTYFVSIVVAELPQYIFFPFLFTVIVYFMAGLTPDAGVFFTLVGINVITSNVGISLGNVVSTAFIDLNLAMSVIPILIIPFMIFGGFYVNADTVPIYFSWLQYLSFLRYSFEAVAINQWDTVHKIPGCENFTCPHNGTDVLATLHFSASHFNLNIIILCIMFVVLKFAAFCILLTRSYFINQ